MRTDASINLEGLVDVPVESRGDPWVPCVTGDVTTHSVVRGEDGQSGNLSGGPAPGEGQGWEDLGPVRGARVPSPSSGPDPTYVPPPLPPQPPSTPRR